MLAFAAAVFFLIISPGPGVLSTAGVGAAYGYRNGLAYVAGLFAGSNLVAMLVISGVAASALALPWLRTTLLIMNLIWIPLHLGWLGAGISLRRIDLGPQAQRRVNIAMALSMLVAVGLALWSHT